MRKPSAFEQAARHIKKLFGVPDNRIKDAEAYNTMRELTYQKLAGQLPQKTYTEYSRHGANVFDLSRVPTPTPYIKQSAYGQALDAINPPQQNFPVYTDSNKFLKEIALPITRRYKIPDKVAAGMFAGEGRLTGLGARRHNYYNIGAYDSNPNLAFDYATPQAGVEAYAKLISGQYKLANGQFDTRYSPAYKLRNDPVAMIKMIHKLGYATRPDYANFIQSTPEWNEY